MIMSNQYFLLERRDLCDVLTCRSPRCAMVLMPGQLEELAKFLGPLFEDIFIAAARAQLEQERNEGSEPC